VARRLEADPRAGSGIAADRIAARAGVAALEGRLDAAIAGYREALSRHRSIGADFNVAQLALDFVMLVGGDHPATRDVAAEARAIFERVKARPYLERLEAAMARHAPDAPVTLARDSTAVSGTPG
jgi:hypothetical protein